MRHQDMAFYWLSLTALVVLHIFLSNPIQGEKCDNRSNHKTPSRIFHVVYDGPFVGSPDRATMQHALGECRTPEAHVDSMIEHFQSRYGINLTHIRPYAFSGYEDDDYIVRFNSAKPGKPDILLYGTNQSYANFMNTEFYWSVSSLRPKSDIRTQLTTLKAGRRYSYGIYRSTVDGRLICFERWNRDPKGEEPVVPNLLPFDLILRSPQLGEGESRGMGLLKDNHLSFRHTLSFP